MIRIRTFSSELIEIFVICGNNSVVIDVQKCDEGDIRVHVDTSKASHLNLEDMAEFCSAVEKAQNIANEFDYCVENYRKSSTAVLIESKSMDIEQPCHNLKVYPEYFEAILAGAKNFEVRRNDRNFLVGERLKLQEFNPDSESFTGRSLIRVVTYVLSGGQFGIEQGFVVLGLREQWFF